MAGNVYRSTYVEGPGRASLVMTGNPDVIMISTDQNRCDSDSCSMVAIGSDLYAELFRIVKIGETGDDVSYRAEPLNPKSGLTVTISANLSMSNSAGWNPSSSVPKKMVLQVEYKGSSRLYNLDLVGHLL